MAYLIPPKIYVGFRDSRNLTKMGEAVPLLEERGDSDRKDRIDRWADTDKYEIETWENDPIEGFRIAFDKIEEYHSGSSWNVEDPRGGYITISSNNMANLMSRTVVAGGLIQGKCAWLRDGGQNLLVLEDSDEYQEAFKQSVARMSRVSLRDVQRGDVVALHDGNIVTYLGLSRVCDLFRNSADNFVRHFFDFRDIKKRYFYLVHNEDGTKHLGAKSSIKVGYIKEKASVPLTDKQAFELAAQHDISHDDPCCDDFDRYLVFYAPKKYGASDIEIVFEEKISSPKQVQKHEIIVTDIGDPEHLLAIHNNGRDSFPGSPQNGYLIRRDRLQNGILYLKPEASTSQSSSSFYQWKNFHKQDVYYGDHDDWYRLRIRLKDDVEYERPIKISYI